MSRVLVTGGAGFVGSHIAIACREQLDTHVIVIDNLHRSGSELNVPRLESAGITFFRGDIRDPEAIAETGPCDLLIECSAEPAVTAGMDGSPDYVVHTNLTGAVHCFEHARRHGAGVVFLSTSRVYPYEQLRMINYREGDSAFVLEANQKIRGVSADGIAEDFPLEGVRSYYGATKLAAEIMIAEYAHAADLPYVINRFGVIAGPWQFGKTDQGVAALWAARHVFGGQLSYIGFGGAGRQVRDFLHIDDAVRLIMMEIENLESLSGLCVNAGGGVRSSASLAQLTEMCRDITGHTIEIGGDPETRPADIPIYITDNSAITDATGWTPEHDVRRVLADTAEWMQNNKRLLGPIFIN